VIVVAVAGLIAYSLIQAPASPCTSTWRCGPHYPVQIGGTYGVAGEQCVINSTTIYCVGGVDANGGPRNDVYAGTTSSSGNITSWIQVPGGYPQDISGASCVGSGGYVYCVGGIHDDAGDDIADAYFAQTTSGGLSAWRPTTPYPVPVDSESCVTSASRIYCMAGNNQTGGVNSNSAASRSVWFAPLTTAGIGNWSRTTPYPPNIYDPTCAETSGVVFCLGGSDSNGNPVGTVYYAALSEAGVGEWIQTTSYPLSAIGEACTASGGSLYCVGGETSGGQSPSFASAVYYAQASTVGVAGWKAGTAFPNTVGTACAASLGYIYCVGGFDESSVGISDAVNYASLASLGQ
jgi:hypothetical protein